MSMLRVVVYAEGPGELAGPEKGRQRAPGTALLENELGAAHFLVRRCLGHVCSLDAESVHFEEPLRHQGRLAYGSVLHGRNTLRRLLSWADERKRPDLALVLVDADGKDDRQEELDAAIEGVPVRAVVAVAIQEFEAWLIADGEALEVLFRKPLMLPGKSPERLGRRKAKELLQQWSDEHASRQPPDELRRELARTCNLGTLAHRCPAFSKFLRKLGVLLGNGQEPSRA
jgi:hypothetical protein